MLFGNVPEGSAGGLGLVDVSDALAEVVLAVQEGRSKEQETRDSRSVRYKIEKSGTCGERLYIERNKVGFE